MNKLLTPADLQAVFTFFGTQAAQHFAAQGVVHPACVMVWMAAQKAEVQDLHQFPTEEVVSLMQSDEGKHQLAHAIRAILSPEEMVPVGRRPDAVVQVLLSAGSAVDAGAAEALLLMVHTLDASYAVAVPVSAETGTVALPASFDLEQARVAQA